MPCFFRGSFAFRHVPIHAVVTSEFSYLIEQRHSSTFKNNAVASLMSVDRLYAAERLPGCQDRPEQISAPTGLCLRHQIERCLAKHFFRLISEEIENFRATVCEEGMLIDFPTPIACRFYQGPKPPLDFSQNRFCPIDSLSTSCAVSIFLR